MAKVMLYLLGRRLGGARQEATRLVWGPRAEGRIERHRAMRGERGIDTGFQNNQNANIWEGVVSQSQYIREPFLEVINSIPLPPDRAMSNPTQVNKHLTYLLSSLGKMS